MATVNDSPILVDTTGFIRIYTPEFQVTQEARRKCTDPL